MRGAHEGWRALFLRETGQVRGHGRGGLRQARQGRGQRTAEHVHALDLRGLHDPHRKQPAVLDAHLAPVQSLGLGDHRLLRGLVLTEGHGGHFPALHDRCRSQPDLCAGHIRGRPGGWAHQPRAGRLPSPVHPGEAVRRGHRAFCHVLGLRISNSDTVGEIGDGVAGGDATGDRRCHRRNHLCLRHGGLRWVLGLGQQGCGQRLGQHG
mmetsp:Transcript_37462/g.85166  ORF Transcript_37462/g.85166 Transcript_37462/m.85166 type:complete len:208 (-) Transcript_37462:565-1188(-)